MSREDVKPARKRLEDHDPGATKEEVIAALKRAAITPKPPDTSAKKNS